jgi:hypothetical protein
VGVVAGTAVAVAGTAVVVAGMAVVVATATKSVTDWRDAGPT